MQGADAHLSQEPDRTSKNGVRNVSISDGGEKPPRQAAPLPAFDDLETDRLDTSYVPPDVIAHDGPCRR